MQATQLDFWNLKYSWLIVTFKFSASYQTFSFLFELTGPSATKLKVPAHISKNFDGLSVPKNISRHLHILHRSGTWKKRNVKFFIPLNVPLSAKEPVQRWWCSSGSTACPVGKGIQDPSCTSMQYSSFYTIGYDFWHHLLVWIITAYVLMQTSVSTPVNIRNFTAHMF